MGSVPESQSAQVKIKFGCPIGVDYVWYSSNLKVLNDTVALCVLVMIKIATRTVRIVVIMIDHDEIEGRRGMGLRSPGADDAGGVERQQVAVGVGHC